MISRIVTHKYPHVDELAGIWMLKRFGESKLPGVKNAQIECTDQREFPGSSKTMEQQGTLLVGIGGGRFDEHAANGSGRKAASAVSIIAEFLGISSDPRLSNILAYVEANDEKGTKQGPFDFASLVSALNDLGNGQNIAMAYNFTAVALDALYTKAARFEKAAEDVMRAAEIRNFSLTMPDRRLTIALVDSDNPQAVCYCFSRRISVVVVKNEIGNVQILVNKRARLDMTHVAAEVRREECKALKIQADELGLFDEGSVCNWYWQSQGQMLLNGSKTAAAPATKLPKRQIADIIIRYAK